MLTLRLAGWSRRRLANCSEARNILKFQIWKFLKNLLGGETVGEKVQHVANPNSHATNTGPPSALLWVHCNSMCKFNQVQILSAWNLPLEVFHV